MELTTSLAHRVRVFQRMRLSYLLSMVAHDINGPLTVINGYASRLEDLPTDETQITTETIKNISESGLAISRAVERISAILKKVRVLSVDDSNVQPELVTVSNLLELSLPFYKCLLREGVKLSSESGLISVLCRPAGIAQAIGEIVLNAIEAKDKNTPATVIVSAERLAQGVIIKVSDSGQSLLNQSELQNKIFNPFFTTKDQTTHLGLGLYWARSIIEEQGGTLTVECVTGSTSFILSLP